MQGSKLFRWYDSTKTRQAFTSINHVWFLQFAKNWIDETNILIIPWHTSTSGALLRCPAFIKAGSWISASKSESVRSPWWCHQMETFSALLAICAGNSPVTGEFPAQRPVTRSFAVFFDPRLNKRLSKQSWGWWFRDAIAPIMTSQ